MIFQQKTVISWKTYHFQKERHHFQTETSTFQTGTHHTRIESGHFWTCYFETEAYHLRTEGYHCFVCRKLKMTRCNENVRECFALIPALQHH